MNVGVRKKARIPSFWFGQFDAEYFEDMMSVNNCFCCVVFFKEILVEMSEGYLRRGLPF